MLWMHPSQIPSKSSSWGQYLVFRTLEQRLSNLFINLRPCLANKVRLKDACLGSQFLLPAWALSSDPRSSSGLFGDTFHHPHQSSLMSHSYFSQNSLVILNTPTQYVVMAWTTDFVRISFVTWYIYFFDQLVHLLMNLSMISSKATILQSFFSGWDLKYLLWKVLASTLSSALIPYWICSKQDSLNKMEHLLLLRIVVAISAPLQPAWPKP